MKLRIKGNSIRFRLTQTEVATLCEMGRVTEQTNFGETVLEYTVRVSDKINVMEAHFRGMSVRLLIPPRLLRGWATNDTTGFYHKSTLGNEEVLELILEKDFACLDGRGEDESDNYPNPKNAIPTNE